MLGSISTRRETLAVMRAMAVVFFCAWLGIGLRAGNLATGDALAATDLLPWQRLFGGLDGPLQRRFREMEEGIAEAERARGAKNAWPEVASLAADGVPPFAPDPIDKAGYTWRLSREERVVNYRGTPADASAPELLVVIQEPERGAVDLGAGASDETHHTLADGTLLHVTFWYRASHAAGASLVDRPFAEGWTQILSGAARKESS